MSWSTSVTIECGEDELPVLTGEQVDAARDAVRAQLDQYSEHDTFAGAVAAARSILQFGPGPRVVYLSGHASATARQGSAQVVVPANTD